MGLAFPGVTFSDLVLTRDLINCSSSLARPLPRQPALATLFVVWQTQALLSLAITDMRL